MLLPCPTHNWKSKHICLPYERTHTEIKHTNLCSTFYLFTYLKQCLTHIIKVSPLAFYHPNITELIRLNVFRLKPQLNCITIQAQTLSPTHKHTYTHLLPAVTDVPVTGENEFRIVSELSRELIVAWPLFMKRIKAKRLVCLVTISQQR